MKSHPAGFEPARGNPIGFQVQHLIHSATNACKKIFDNESDFGIHFEIRYKISKSHPPGFEPARGNPIGFQVQRLNHSATNAVLLTT